MDVKIVGSQDLQALAKRLRREGEHGKGLRKELLSAIQRGTKPVRLDAKAAALRELPHHGGLNRVVAKAKFSTKTATGGRNLGVRIVAKGEVVRSADRGFIRHPVYGNRKVWVSQSVDGGWFTDTMRATAPGIQREIIAAMRDVAARIARG